MSVHHFIGNEMDSLVKKLAATPTDINLVWDVVKVMETEKEDLQAQLFCYAQDIQKLLAERDIAALNENEKNAAYKQLERFNHDFMILMAQKEKSYQALESSHLDTIRRLATAAEFKDDDTGAHILRMSRFSSIIARAYGQDEKYCNLLEQASPMHDIGKIGIPDDVLKKPGKLTEAEWVLMRKHPEYGANILSGSDVPVLQMAEEVALAHHEKFDGSGYPSNLQGEQIPLSARIVALADFFDALTMDRCYRPAFSDEKALTMVKENSGTHFDPKVVQAFFSVSNDIINERDRINKEN
ncbi:HD domain-containing protein [Colwellia sp. MB02u-18]|uniref:HD-GYP domain-containing protein n=1 Tax=unclassified Colwellia TaxID=196834 RepID=UPI0015F6778B|nr:MULTISPECIES: HD domain-containing phosphohydrolase [unclassified Colwellia]MBA6224025.1 HD domain-containing protein [Colwellia sp. MB3u-45]MBA6266512.1 HD domain-containing protein [Colwellia sp. MB3u-43]MBA6320206.1 HD domain-containing protein [Colwellia sp. MB02u-19]MBA6326017.1 HD domain-containing protein [Colwellia sp. MB02u-18]MBA6332660.1 HD domain-containing protein [Colwellia sp. MB02u-12]